MSKIISFASDFGLNDGSVGVVKGVISRIDDSLKVNDISHGIPPQDIKYGSLLLMRAIQYIPQGVLLAVVDPGVCLLYTSPSPRDQVVSRMPSSA